MLLKDKTILVTGSTTGIGEAIARRCVGEGANVMIHGLNEDKARTLCQELGHKSRYILADLQDASSLETLIATTVAEFGRLDGLVNNAGIYPRTTIDTSDETIFDYIMAINTKAPLLLTKYAVNAFRQQKTPGVIVNIGSINAYCGQNDLLVYSMSKGALMTMTRNLGNSLSKEKIRVIQLNVGWTVTDTEIATKKYEGFPENWEEHVPAIFAPSGKLLRPDNIAPHVAFWLSEQSAPASGIVYDLEQYPIIGRNLISEIKM